MLRRWAFQWCRKFHRGKRFIDGSSRPGQVNVIFFHYENSYTIGIQIWVIYTPCHTHFTFDDRFQWHSLLKIAKPYVDTIWWKIWSERCLLILLHAITHVCGAIWQYYMLLHSSAPSIRAYELSFFLKCGVIIAIIFSLRWPLCAILSIFLLYITRNK